MARWIGPIAWALLLAAGGAAHIRNVAETARIAELSRAAAEARHPPPPELRRSGLALFWHGQRPRPR